MKKVKINIGFFALMLLISLIASKSLYALVSIIASVIHELGHVCAARVLNIRLTEFDFELLGARLKLSERLYSYKQEILLALGGPFFNFLSAALLFFIKPVILSTGFWADAFIFSSLALGALNLLPISTFDGGRIFEALLLNFLSPNTVRIIMEALSFLSIFVLWSISVYFLLIYSYSLNLFVFTLSLFCHFFIKIKQ